MTHLLREASLSGDIEGTFECIKRVIRLFRAERSPKGCDEMGRCEGRCVGRGLFDLKIRFTVYAEHALTIRRSKIVV